MALNNAAAANAVAGIVFIPEDDIVAYDFVRFFVDDRSQSMHHPEGFFHVIDVVVVPGGRLAGILDEPAPIVIPIAVVLGEGADSRAGGNVGDGGG